MALGRTYDAIIVGSGFGGAVTACRLAEGKHRVLVLERGRKWEVDEYPSQTGGEDFIYDSDDPLDQHGWIEFHVFRRMVVATGAGVGGGSLVYANVSAVPPEQTFAQGWPPEITFQSLQQHYEEAGQMLGVQQIPDGQLTKRFELMREGAKAIGDSARFGKMDLAVSFNPLWKYALPDRFEPVNSVSFTNAFGRKQGTCVHTGNCDLGCPVRAKNTLDVNYLARAEDEGAEIRPLHLVRYIEPVAEGYRVIHDRIDTENDRLVRGSDTARWVVLAAGSLGSTEILLRSRDQYRTLPRVSPRLGSGWSGNGNFLTPASYRSSGREVSPTHGPTITSHIDYLDGASGGVRYSIEDGGIPPILRDFLLDLIRGGRFTGPLKAARSRRTPAKGKRNPFQLILGELRKALSLAWFRNWIEGDDELPHLMPWFANGVDASNGRLYLGRYWYAFWEKRLKLHWDVRETRKLIDAIVARHVQLSKATGGQARIPPTWRYLHQLITPHPLGGCRMGANPGNGVVDHRGQVFGHPGLYVIDGAVLPYAIGLNPSRTIAAVAERNARLLAEEMKKPQPA